MLGGAESKTSEIMEKIVRDADKMTVKEAVINNLLLSNTIYNESAKRMNVLTKKIEETQVKVGEDVNEIKGAILQLTGLATKVEKIVEDNEEAKKEVLEMIAAIKKDLEIKIDTNKEISDNKIEQVENRVDKVENTNIKYGVYMRILGVIGTACIGVIVAEYFNII